MNNTIDTHGWGYVRVGLMIVGMLLCLNTYAAQADQDTRCFADARHAYQHVLAQQANDEHQRATQGVNINRATEAELTTLQGIGSKKAQAIVLYREMFGDFVRIEDLTNVKGIGAKTVEKNRARLQVQD